MFRVVQEGLSNARKHARGGAVAMIVAHDGRELTAAAGEPERIVGIHPPEARRSARRASGVL